MNQPAHAIPLLRSNEEQLAKMCRRLEDLFNNLNLVHDLMVVCAHAVAGEGDCCSEAARCLEFIGGNRLYSQLKALTNIIEKLGGTTEFTEREAETKAILADSRAKTSEQPRSPGEPPQVANISPP